MRPTGLMKKRTKDLRGGGVEQGLDLKPEGNGDSDFLRWGALSLL